MRLTHVYGHAANPWNELADVIAGQLSVGDIAEMLVCRDVQLLSEQGVAERAIVVVGTKSLPNVAQPVIDFLFLIVPTRASKGKEATSLSLSAATFNIRTRLMPGRRKQLCEELLKHGVDIICWQETRLSGQTTSCREGWLQVDGGSDRRAKANTDELAVWFNIKLLRCSPDDVVLLHADPRRMFCRGRGKASCGLSARLMHWVRGFRARSVSAGGLNRKGAEPSSSPRRVYLCS